MEGISFVVRVRNEEATLEECLRSLKPLTIQYEVIVVLHLCTDGSREIAERLQAEGMPIKIYEYTVPLSRAGYETLVTDADSPHSMVYYSKWCFGKATRYWKFLWDADFVMTPGLLRYLNEIGWGWSEPTRIRIPTDPGTNMGEHYLFTGELKYTKYLFWELKDVEGHHTDMNVYYDDAYIHHNSTLDNKKEYWDEPSWFLTDTSEEAQTVKRRYEFLCQMCGPEVIGHARCGNPISGGIEGKVYGSEGTLATAGIRFWS